jgi:CDP-glycerol glycerophosphotransferase
VGSRPNYTEPMASPPLLTVALAMFNSHDVISNALESVFSQGFHDLEVIVVNDGSTDDSLAIAQSVDTRGVVTTFVSHPTNQGLGPARNTAISHATGRYIVFLDSDDELLPGSLEAIGSVAEQSEADLLLVGCVERKRGRDKAMNPQDLLTKVASSPAPWQLDEHPELFFWPPSTWAKVYRREFLVTKRIEFPPGYHQDIPSTIAALLEADSIGAVDHPCYLYIRRGEGSSSTRSKGTKTLVRIQQIQRIRARHDVGALPRVIRAHLVALVSIHLIWANRAAYRTMPEELHEQFFLDSAKELAWWWQHGQPGSDIDSDALLTTSERVFFTRALLSGSYSRWTKALSKHQRALSWRRRFDLSRYGLFKAR